MRRVAIVTVVAVVAGAAIATWSTATPKLAEPQPPRGATIDHRAPPHHAPLITGVHVEKDSACVGEQVVVRVDTVADRALRVKIANTPGTMAAIEADRPGPRQIAIVAEDEVSHEVDAASGSFVAVDCAGTVARVAIVGRAAPADVTASWLDGPCGRDGTYHWDYGDGTSDDGTAPDTAHAYPVAERAQTYLLTVEQRGANGCTASAHTTVRIATTRETERLQAASHAAADGVLAERLARSRERHAQLGLD